MKKLLIVLVCMLTGCTAETPNAIRPYVGGPVYYKQPTCVVRQTYPKVVNRWNYELGINETYITNSNIHETICNYNSNVYGLYGRY